jgi:Ca2+-binding EF-hand superfamily protein
VRTQVGHLIEDPFGSKTTVQRPVRSSGATRQPPKDAVGLEDEIGYYVQEEKVIVDMFKRLDKDKKGNVTIAELEEGLPAIFADMGLPASKIQEMIGGLDVDGDGLVLVEEFLSTWTLMFGSGGMRQLEALPLSAYCDMVLRDSLYYWNVCSSKAFTPMQLEQSMLQIAGTKAFETIDKDGSGRITQEELRDAMPPWCSDEDLVREFKKMDGERLHFQITYD